jgi:hypothetical protein
MDSNSCRLLNIKETSQFLSLSIASVRILVSTGRLASLRSSPRGKYLFDVRELERFIRENSRLNDAREEVK